MSTETYLQCGWINPYHYEEPKDHMELAACAIISNLEGRAGINLDFNLDTRKEIVNEIVQIIDDAPAYFEKMQQHPNAGPEGLVDGNELPDLWWLMSPEFIQHAIKELNLKGDNEPHCLVLERYIDDLVNRGYLKDARNGRRQSGSPKFDGSYTSYQQQLLQTVSATKVGEPKQLMHILIEIPQDADNFVYMQRITEITKGVLSFVNVRLTFIGYSLSVFTMDL